MRSAWIFPLVLGILAFQCEKDAGQDKKSILVGGIPLRVEISDTQEERVMGLMFRDKLEWNEGMLFVFENEDTLSFWMRNTSIHLSIAFMDERGVIIDIQDMKPFAPTVHKSNGYALYALEMNRGWFAMNGIEVGDRVSMQLD